MNQKLETEKKSEAEPENSKADELITKETISEVNKDLPSSIHCHENLLIMEPQQEQSHHVLELTTILPEHPNPVINKAISCNPINSRSDLLGKLLNASKLRRTGNVSIDHIKQNCNVTELSPKKSTSYIYLLYE